MAEQTAAERLAALKAKAAAAQQKMAAMKAAAETAPAETAAVAPPAPVVEAPPPPITVVAPPAPTVVAPPAPVAVAAPAPARDPPSFEVVVDLVTSAERVSAAQKAALDEKAAALKAENDLLAGDPVVAALKLWPSFQQEAAQRASHKFCVIACFMEDAQESLFAPLIQDLAARGFRYLALPDFLQLPPAAGEVFFQPPGRALMRGWKPATRRIPTAPGSGTPRFIAAEWD